MSLSDIRPHFRTKLKSLGLEEWKDPFNFENIPENRIDRSFHMKWGPLGPGTQTQIALEMNMPLEVRVFMKGNKDIYGRYEDAENMVDSVLGEIMETESRTCEIDDIKNIKLVNVTIDPLDISNDNTLVILFEFEVLFFKGF